MGTKMTLPKKFSQTLKGAACANPVTSGLRLRHRFNQILLTKDQHS